MEFKSAKCPSCFGELQVPDNKDFVICMYCGTNIKVRDSIKIVYDANLPNWFKIANSARDSGQYEEAYEYYNKILEIDSDNSDAWFGKGIAAGYMSTLYNIRINEMMTCFKNSIASSTDDRKELLNQKIVDYIDSVVSRMHPLVRKHCVEFISAKESWYNYISQCKIMLNSLEYCHELLPDKINIMKKIIFLCNDNIRGIGDYGQGNEENKFLFRQISNEYKQELQKKLSDFDSKIKEIDLNHKTQLENSREKRELRDKQNKQLLIAIGVVLIIFMIILILSNKL